MRRRTLAAAILLLGLTGTVRAGEEPGTYAGRDAAWWLEELKVTERAAAGYVAFRVIGEAGYPVLARALREGDDTLRERAARALLEAKGDYRLVLPDLIAALEDENHVVRRRVAKALRHLGPGAKPAVPALAGRLADSRADVRRETCTTLVAIGEAAAAAEDALLEALHTGDPTLKRYAVSALSKVVPGSARTVEALGVALDTPDVKLRRKIAECLPRFRPGTPGLSSLVRAVRADPDSGVRLYAAKVLLALAGDDEAVIPDIIALVRDDDRPEVVVEAAGALAALGEKAAPAIPHLIERLTMPKAYYRVAAALIALHPWSTGALADALADPDPKRAEMALYALRHVPRERVQTHADRLVPGLHRMIGAGTAKPHDAWQRALLLAMKVAEGSDKVLGFLLGLHAHQEPVIRDVTAMNLVRFVPASHAALLEMLGSEVASERAFAFQAIGSTGRVVRIKGAKEALLALLEHPWPEVRERAVRLLMNAGTPYWLRLGAGVELPAKTKRILAETLARTIEASDARWSRHAARLLPLLGTESVVAIPVLVAATSHPDLEKAAAAARALAEIAPWAETPPTVNLLGRLDDENRAVAAGAALALALLGHDPEALLPRIHEFVGSEDAAVAEKARAALAAIEAREP